MPSRRIPSSPVSSPASPPIVIEVRRSSRLLAGSAAFAACLAAGLWRAEGPHWLLRLLGAVTAASLGWGPVRDLILLRGPGAVRRVEWDGRGPWQVTDGAGVTRPMELAPGSAALGPWLLLAWRDSRGRCLRALIDAAADRGAFKALKGRLNC